MTTYEMCNLSRQRPSNEHYPRALLLGSTYTIYSAYTRMINLHILKPAEHRLYINIYEAAFSFEL